MTFTLSLSVAEMQFPISDAIIPSWEPNSPQGRLEAGGTDTPRLSPEELRDFSDCEGAFWHGLIFAAKEGGFESTGVGMAWPGPLSAAHDRFDPDGTGRFSTHTHIDMAGIIHQHLKTISLDNVRPTSDKALLIDDSLTDIKFFLDWRIEILDNLNYELEIWSDSMMHLAQDLHGYTVALRRRINEWRCHNASFVDII